MRNSCKTCFHFTSDLTCAIQKLDFNEIHSNDIRNLALLIFQLTKLSLLIHADIYLFIYFWFIYLENFTLKNKKDFLVIFVSLDPDPVFPRIQITQTIRIHKNTPPPYRKKSLVSPFLVQCPESRTFWAYLQKRLVL